MDDPELTAIRARKLERLQTQAVAPTSETRPVKITDSSFDAEVAKPGLILVDFWAAWCGPCVRVAPVLDQMAKEMAGTLRVGKLNVDENPSTSMRFGVTSIPTMLLFKDGKLVDGIVGAYPRPQIEAVVRKWT